MYLSFDPNRLFPSCLISCEKGIPTHLIRESNLDSDVMLVASIRGNDGDSDYVESSENSPTSPANITDLAGHINEVEAMHKVSEGDIDAISRPTVIFSHTDELEIPKLADDETDPPENHQDNSVTPLVNTHPSPPHSPPEDTLVASAKPLPRPHVKAVYAALQVQEGDLPDVRLLGADYILYGFYQDWVHQNQGDHLYGKIVEYSKWQ